MQYISSYVPILWYIDNINILDPDDNIVHALDPPKCNQYRSICLKFKKYNALETAELQNN